MNRGNWGKGLRKKGGGGETNLIPDRSIHESCSHGETSLLFFFPTLNIICIASALWQSKQFHMMTDDWKSPMSPYARTLAVQVSLSGDDSSIYNAVVRSP